MASYTKLLQVSKETYNEVLRRDEGCLFCKLGYHMHPKFPNVLDCMILDAMHYIPKSSMGLGRPENLVIGCRYHHGLLDNGNKGLRTEMLQMMVKHLKSLYPKWDKEKLTYKKYGDYYGKI